MEAPAYEEYGSTLINFAEKISLMPFPFASGISGSMAQMQKRILNIVTYHPVTFRKKLRGIFSYALIAVFLLGFVPVLSTQAADRDLYLKVPVDGMLHGGFQRLVGVPGIESVFLPIPGNLRLFGRTGRNAAEIV